MAVPLKSEPRLTATAFMVWYDAQPAGRRYELLDGRVYEMQSERLAHGRAKLNTCVALRRGVAERGLPCEALVDGMAVKIDDETVFEPDVMVRCGSPLPGETTLIPDPVIVVEVLSPSTQHVDVVRKFSRYFHNPHVTHYLIVNTIDKLVVHHRRAADGRIVSSSHEDGVVALDPPGLSLDVAEIFAEAA